MDKGTSSLLQHYIAVLIRLTEKLQRTSLKHNPAALHNYFQSLLETAKAQGAGPEQIQSLAAAKRAMQVQTKIADKKDRRINESTILIQVVNEVKRELTRRNKLSHFERAREEEKPSQLYNILLRKVPLEIKEKAPAQLPTPSWRSRGALFPENLKAIVILVKIILQSGCVSSIAHDN